MKSKQSSQCKDWCFTLNNYKEESVANLSAILSGEHVRYAIFGKEITASGTPHLQGYLCCVKKQRFHQVRKLLGNDKLHIEARKGSHQQARDYCKKDGDFTEFGEDSGGKGRRSDLQEVTREIINGANMRDVAANHPTEFVKYSRGLRNLALMVFEPFIPSGLRGFWFYGEAGTGKSRKARSLYPNAYLKSQNKWWDGYAGEDTVILDDCDSVNPGFLHLMKLWTDRYAITDETKGGTVPLQYERFIVTSNWSLSEIIEKQMEESHDKCYPALARRFKQFEFRREFIPPNAGETGSGSWVTIEIPKIPDALEPFD